MAVTKFAVFWTIDALIATIFVFFFVIGLGDGSVSSFNIGLWLVTLLVLAGVVLGSASLKRAGRPGLALILALTLAIPGLLVGLFFAVLILGNPDWR